jgi:hypothetical protein
MQGGLPDYHYNGDRSLHSDDNVRQDTLGNPESIYNKNSYPAFDANNQDIGLDTPLDKMFHENESSVSPNPMDTNWGGPEFTDQLIQKGFYKDNEVSKSFI